MPGVVIAIVLIGTVLVSDGNRKIKEFCEIEVASRYSNQSLTSATEMEEQVKECFKEELKWRKGCADKYNSDYYSWHSPSFVGLVRFAT